MGAELVLLRRVSELLLALDALGRRRASQRELPITTYLVQTDVGVS
jgi:hypothetical protein